MFINVNLSTNPKVVPTYSKNDVITHVQSKLYLVLNVNGMSKVFRDC